MCQSRFKLLQMLQSLISHLIIMCFAAIVFVFLLIFDREIEERPEKSEKKSDKRHESWQLVKYTVPPRVLRFDFAGKFYEISIRSGSKSRKFEGFELKEILKLGAAIENQKIFSADPWNRLSPLKFEEEADKQENTAQRKQFALISMQEHLLLQRISEIL